MDSKQLEKYTSAITLSDMEIFVFPELMYGLVLANIMSPIIWQWRNRDCFRKLEGKSSYRKLMRLKQFIMDEYEFNLDLETWGLTHKDTELKRFEEFISPEDIGTSNALFGYHGDEYYFDVDIRRHFGLDKYDSDIIPYWKTETVEAMNAFALKPGYKGGAGECVSLAALYAAAAFIVCEIPLEDIYMILTPLHSQNFFDLNGGVLTNNRRIVTRTMWFNGTAISNKSQRALRNEQITMVTHNTGYMHCFYKDASIRKSSYDRFNQQLKNFLTTELSTEIIANFLRCNSQYQKYFQFCCYQCRGKNKFAKAEVLFHYEHGSNYSISDGTFEKLLEEVSDEDVLLYKLNDRVCCNQLNDFIKYENADIHTEHGRQKIKEFLVPFIPEADKFISELYAFVYIEPRLPASDKNFLKNQPIQLSVEQSRQEIISYLQEIRVSNTMADLAFYAYRDMETCEWKPFIKAAMERNPVSLEMTASMSVAEAYDELGRMSDESIYDGKRLAQPDEVTNYRTGDGLEKAFLLANLIHSRNPEQLIEMDVNNNEVTIGGADEYRFASAKGFKKHIEMSVEKGVQVV